MHPHRFTWPAAAIAIVVLLFGSIQGAAAQVPADNTKVNAADRAKGAPTADQQKDNSGDRDIAQKIRRALMQDKALSTYAHNVKVIVQHGDVTLKGPVRSAAEKHTVEAKAVDVAGAGHVTNQITIASRKKASK